MYKKIIIFAFILIQLNIAKSQDFRRYFIGLNFLGASSNDPNFHTFKPFDRTIFPDLKYSSVTSIADFDGINLQLSFESGIATHGYKYSLKKDSNDYFRSYGLHLGLGLGADFSETNLIERPIPISFYISPFIQWMNLISVYNDNSKTTYIDIADDDMFIPNYGINFQIMYNLNPESEYCMEVYYCNSLGLKEIYNFNKTYSHHYINNTVGIILKIQY